MEKLSLSITTEILEKALSYKEYRSLIDTLLENNQTTGPNQSEYYIDYTRMNQRRMKRWEKTAKVSSELVQKTETITTEQNWLIFLCSVFL